MRSVEIVAVGSELLTPHYQDTNSLFLTGRLNALGMEVSFKTVVGDVVEDIQRAIGHALGRADLVLVMGGLGPTRDDLTREAAARALGLSLVPVQAVMERIEARFKKRGLPMPGSNRKQADILEGAEVLPNEYGTAPGQWLELDDKRLALLPGPPHELAPLFERHVLPRLEPFRRGFLHQRVLKIAGLTESRVEDLMQGLDAADDRQSITILAKPGQIELHLTARSSLSLEEAAGRLEPLAASLRSRLGENIFSQAGESLEVVVGSLLRSAGKTLACAESCSGGLISHRLTDVPGSSDYFLGGLVAYANRTKEELLGVPAQVLRDHGAVSDRAAEAMAEGVRRVMGSDFGLAVTGIAGPGGGTDDKPVGLVYAALAWDNGRESERNQFLGNRDQVKFQSSQKALDMLRRLLLRRRS